MIPKNHPNLIAQWISFEKEIPSGGSQAGDISPQLRSEKGLYPHRIHKVIHIVYIRKYYL